MICEKIEKEIKSMQIRYKFAMQLLDFFNGLKDPLSTNNLLPCLSTLLLRSYMFFCVRKYKLHSYIDSCKGTARVRHSNSKKTPVSWFTNPVEQLGLMIA